MSGLGAVMMFEGSAVPIVEDLRNHSAETVAQLQRLLSSGAPLRAEEGRDNFFEVEGQDMIFYIHVSPATGKVWLLAAWPRENGCLWPSQRVA